MAKSESFNKNSKPILISIFFIDTLVIFGLLIISCEKEYYKSIMVYLFYHSWIYKFILIVKVVYPI